MNHEAAPEGPELLLDYCFSHGSLRGKNVVPQGRDDLPCLTGPRDPKTYNAPLYKNNYQTCYMNNSSSNLKSTWLRDLCQISVFPVSASIHDDNL